MSTFQKIYTTNFISAPCVLVNSALVSNKLNFFKKAFPFTLLILCFAAVWSQPVNDTPCSATTLTVGTSCSYTAGTTVGATNTGGLPAPPCGGVGKDVWYAITVPASGMFTLETASGSIVDGILTVYTGTCASLTEAYCDDDSGPGLMPLLECTGFIPGSVVLVRFFKKGGGTGTFSICAWDDNPPLGANNDCVTAQQLCTEVTFTANSTSAGDVDDLTGANKGCLNPDEHQSSWYYFTFGSPGEFSFTLTPFQATDNYNFAIWGPDPECPLTEDPLRCSAANTTGPTGISTGATDVSETAGGDGWVKFINVFAGETYLLLIDNYSESGSGFTFDFEGPPTIDCIDYLLPISLKSFYGYASGETNVVDWTTASELNNAWFYIEHSNNGDQFSSIGQIEGSGTTSDLHNYKFNDPQPFEGTTYYRLKQEDYNGHITYSSIISVENLNSSYFTASPNPSKGTINISHFETAETEYTIEILNSLGVKIAEQKGISSGAMQTNQFTIPVKGIYWIMLNSGNKSYSEKIIIN